MKNYKYSLFFVFISLVVIIISSCENDDSSSKKSNTKFPISDQDSSISVRGEMLRLMQEAYLWYDKIPANADSAEEVPVEDFYYSLLYNSLDKWSFILSFEEFTNMMNGVYYGHGISFNIDEFGKFRVGFVFNSTQAYSMGIGRGWIVNKVNGQKPLNFSHLDELLGADESQTSNVFEFITPEGTTESFTLTKEMVNMNAVLASNIIEFGGHKVGYIAIESFLGDNINAEFNSAFSDFKSAAISDLVIDLRYNGGGSLDASLYLASLIAGNGNAGTTFSKLYYNDLIDQYIPDTSKLFSLTQEINSLNGSLNRIFYITSPNTASASETLILGLKPFFETYLIGTRTAGKPVGMNPLQLTTGDYILVPITFQWKNGIEEGCPYTGIPVDFQEFDDLSQPLGDTTELCLKQVVHFIKNNKFDIRKKSMFTDYNRYNRNWRGLKAEVGAY